MNASRPPQDGGQLLAALLPGWKPIELPDPERVPDDLIDEMQNAAILAYTRLAAKWHAEFDLFLRKAVRDDAPALAKTIETDARQCDQRMSQLIADLRAGKHRDALIAKVAPYWKASALKARAEFESLRTDASAAPEGIPYSRPSDSLAAFVSRYRKEAYESVMARLSQFVMGETQSGPPDGVERDANESRGHPPTARVRAYLSFRDAEAALERQLEDREAYDWLKENGLPRDSQPGDYRLPPFETWSRYLRRVRNELGEQKYGRRAERPHGKSIVSAAEIELPSRKPD